MEIRAATSLEDDSFALTVFGDIGHGEEEFTYVLSPSDPYGIAPELRDMLASAIAEGKVVPQPYDPVPQSSATTADVIAERERRLALGFDYDFGDERGVHHIGTTPDDMDKWTKEVTPISASAILRGAPDETILIATDTGSVTVTAMEWQHILAAAKDVRPPIYQASFALMAMDPIPADYADDTYWS